MVKEVALVASIAGVDDGRCVGNGNACRNKAVGGLHVGTIVIEQVSVSQKECLVAFSCSCFALGTTVGKYIDAGGCRVTIGYCITLANCGFRGVAYV